MAPDSASIGQSAAASEFKELVEKKVTCPFLGSAAATGKLSVRDHLGNPLALIQDVIELGNNGGGDLGKVLGFFADGNHGLMRGPAGDALKIPVPEGHFSLELPGSQGSHPGHSGILQGDPKQLDSGRFSPEDFERLTKLSSGGFIQRSAIARFIAENIRRDPESQFFPFKVWASEAIDIFTKRDETERMQSLARIAGSNNLLGSAGEFGLLLAFLHNSPRTRKDGKDPAFSMEEITGIFRDKKLPDGWENWEKTAKDWLRHTFALARGAFDELRKMGLMTAVPGKLLALADLF